MLIVHLYPQVSELPLSLQTVPLWTHHLCSVFPDILWAALKHIWVSQDPEHWRMQGPARGRLLPKSGWCGRVSLRRPKLKFDYKQSMHRAMAVNHSYWSVVFPKMHAASLLQKEPWLQRTKEAVSSLKSCHTSANFYYSAWFQTSIFYFHGKLWIFFFNFVRQKSLYTSLSSMKELVSTFYPDKEKINDTLEYHQGWYQIASGMSPPPLSIIY